MSQREIGIEEARKVLGDLVDQVRYTRQPITLTRHGKPAARLVTMEEPMTTTTSYGTWVNYTGYSLTPESVLLDYINGADDDWRQRVEDGPAFEAMVSAYRQAVNDALPAGVSLIGDEFYGPYHDENRDWEGDLDIAEIIKNVDLGEIVQRHDPDNA